MDPSDDIESILYIKSSPLCKHKIIYTIINCPKSQNPFVVCFTIIIKDKMWWYYEMVLSLFSEHQKYIFYVNINTKISFLLYIFNLLS